MGKKKLRAKYTSKGERPNVNAKDCLASRNERSNIQTAINKLDAAKAGKRAYVTVPNSNPNETAKPFVRVKVSESSLMFKAMNK